MAKNTITKRDALTAILARVEDNAELTAYVQNELTLLERKSEKSAEKSAEKAKVYDTMRAQVVDILTANGEGMTVTDMLKTGEFGDITNQKLTYALRQSIKDGTLRKATVKGKTYYSVV